MRRNSKISELQCDKEKVPLTHQHAGPGPLTAREQVEAVGIGGQRSDGVQVGHHRLHHLARVVVPEADVAVFVGRDGQG